MQSIGLADFDALIRRFDDAIRTMPDKQRELHEGAAAILKREIDAGISGSLNDSRGRVKSWQEPRVGTRGGYAAISAISGKGATGNNDSPGAITNYLENGHRIRRPNGNAKRQRPSRARLAYVDGNHFYQDTYNGIEAVVIGMIDEITETLAKKLEG